MAAIILTGASMGIGRALARAWGRRKATLVLSARGEAALREVSREVEAEGGRALAVPGDVTDEAHRRELVARAVDAGGASVLVNNAGRGFYAPALSIDVDEMRALFELNVIAPLRLAQLAAPALAEARGTVVMMSSVAGLVAAPNYGAYAASKFALEAISMAMRAELAERGVRVLVVRPGPVNTPFRANAARAKGVEGYDEPDPKAQRPEAVAEMTIRAVERRRPVLETSAFVRAVSATSRVTPAGLRFAFRRMAAKKG